MSGSGLIDPSLWYFRSDPNQWCKTFGDLARWCTDHVPEEPHKSFLYRLERIVMGSVEHAYIDNAGDVQQHGFYVGDLFYYDDRARSNGGLRGLLTLPGLGNQLVLDIAFAADGTARAELQGPDVESEFIETAMPLDPPRRYPPVPQGWSGLWTGFGTLAGNQLWGIGLTPAYHTEEPPPPR
jgi:hypothetical protein